MARCGGQGSSRYRNRWQESSTHGAGLLPEKPLCSRAPVRAREQEVVHGCEALSLQIAIPLKQLSAFVTIPVLVAIVIASLLLLDDGSYNNLLCKPLHLSIVMAKDGEVAS